MIEKNRLLNYSNIIIYQDTTKFKFSLDSVLLANFVTLRKRDKKIVDLATGNCPIPMLIYNKTNAKIWGIELQKDIFDMGYRSIIENNFDDKITVINDDVKNINKIFESDCFDVVVSNPPYFKVYDNGYLNDVYEKSLARHELTLNLDDVVRVSSVILKTGGVFAIVYRTERFVEVLNIMKKYKIEPKKVQFVYQKRNKCSNIFLIEGIKNGNSGLKLLPPLFVHNDDNSYSNDVNKMFGE